jgi:carboxyl-terminal processing protease
MFDPVSVLPRELRTMPLTVLISPVTATGGEIIAAAVIDARRGIAIGGKSAGIGFVETVFPLGAGYALKLPSAFMIRPNGQMIHSLGITPQVVVDTNEADGLPSEYSAERAHLQNDPSVRVAMEVLADKKDK